MLPTRCLRGQAPSSRPHQQQVNLYTVEVLVAQDRQLMPIRADHLCLVATAAMRITHQMEGTELPPAVAVVLLAPAPEQAMAHAENFASGGSSK